MIRSLIHWFRVVLPGWAVAVFAVVYLVAVAIEIYYHMMLGLPDAPQRSYAVGLGCASYGLYRVAATHPASRPGYFKWLQSTPWTSRQPLPDGPVHLVPQDLVVLAMAWLLLLGRPHGFFVVSLAFLVSYIVSICLVLRETSQRWAVYVSAFGLALAFRLGTQPLVATGVILLLYVPTYVGLRRSLADFPWTDSALYKKLQTQLSFRPGQVPKRVDPTVGWPFDLIGPRQPDNWVRLSDAVPIALLVACWMCAIWTVIPSSEELDPAMSTIYVGICLGAVLGRVGIYCAHCRPPMSVWGRIGTFRWIIPGYDRVFASPLLAMLIVPAQRVSSAIIASVG